MRRNINIFAHIDWITVFLYIALVIMGWINIYAAVYNEEHQSIFDISQRYGKQLLWILAAFLLAFVVYIIDINFYSYFAYLIYILVVLMLLSVLVIGKTVHGAKSWLALGEFLLQPSEFAKFATALALAKYLSAYNIQITRFNSLVVILVLIGIPAVLIFAQPDTGSALVYACFIFVFYREGLYKWVLAIAIILPVLLITSLIFHKITVVYILICLALSAFFLVNTRKTYFFIGTSIVAGLNIFLWFIKSIFNLKIDYYYIIIVTVLISSVIFLFFYFSKKIKGIFVIVALFLITIVLTQTVDFFFHKILKSHQQQRINIMLGIESDPLGIGYNVNQSKIAIGSGGFWGKGFLKGTQTKYDFVPEQTTDFIFCTVGEEWGFVGSVFVVLLFMTLLLRLVILAERQRWAFARIYGYGVVSILFFHFAINIGMTIGLLPVIGIPLPFFSYGGSSLWAFTILLFIFINLDAKRLDVLV